MEWPGEERERERERRVSADLTYIPAKLGPAIACVWLHRDFSLTFGLGDAHDDFDFWHWEIVRMRFWSHCCCALGGEVKLQLELQF